MKFVVREETSPLVKAMNYCLLAFKNNAVLQKFLLNYLNQD